MAKKPKDEVEFLEQQARLLIEDRVAAEVAEYGEDGLWLRDYFQKQLDFALMTFEERYGPDLAERLREQKKYLKDAYLSNRRYSVRDPKTVDEILNAITQLRDRQSSPPRWSEYLLYLVLPKEERETVPGDLLEEYRSIILPKFGYRLARVWFLKQVFASIWPFLKRRVIKALGLASLWKLLH